jgi:hypothetical protein
MNLTQDAPNAMRSNDSNMATNAKNNFLPRKILLSSNMGGAVPASNAFSDAGPGLDFSSSAACLSEAGEMERDVQIDAREGVAVSTSVSFTVADGDLDGGEVMVFDVMADYSCRERF